MDLHEPVKIEFWGRFINAMCRAERASKRIDFGILDKTFGKLGIRIEVLLLLYFLGIEGFSASKNPDFGFHIRAEMSCHLHASAGIFFVFFVRFQRAIVHDGGKAEFQSFLDVFEVLAMIQVNADGDGGLLSHKYHQRPNEFQGGDRFMQLRVHQNDGDVSFSCRVKHRDHIF